MNLGIIGLYNNATPMVVSGVCSANEGFLCRSPMLDITAMGLVMERCPVQAKPDFPRMYAQAVDQMRCSKVTVGLERLFIGGSMRYSA